jgi:magnesium chelatase family protein
MCNAQSSGRWLDAHTPISLDARQVLLAASERLGLSARGFHRVLKVARTIADLDESPDIGRHHASEALFFRAGERLPRVEEAA